MPDQQVEAYRSSTSAAAAAAAAMSVRQLPNVIDFSDLLPTFSQWVDAAIPFVQAAGRRNDDLARHFYEAIRIEEGFTSAPPTWRSVPVEPEALRRSLYATAGDALQGVERFDVQPRVALKRAQIAASGSMIRHAMNVSRNSTIATSQVDPEAVGCVYVTKMDADVCYWCLMLSSRGPVYKGNSFADSDSQFIGQGTAKAHDHCVVAGTLVAGPSVEVGFRRRYEGEVVTVATASGNEMTITPNHPVLTEQGWVPAGLLREGDHVLSAVGSDAGVSAVPDEHQDPSAIEDVLRSLLMVGGTSRVPGSAKQFHGDGTDGEVDVIAPDRLFADRAGAEVPQPAIEQSLTLTGAPRPAVPFANLCAERHFALAGGSPANGGMGSRGQLQTLLGGGAGHSGVHAFGAASGLDSSLIEKVAYDVARDAELFGQGLLGFSGAVAFDEIFGQRVPERSTMRFDPASSEVTGEGGGAYSELGTSLRQRLAGAVRSDRVINVRRGYHSGHVYNLQTAEGWYSANGMIVSNCRCVLVPIKGLDSARLEYSKDLWEQWKAVNYEDGRIKNSGKKALLAWRRHVEDRALG